jgi:hypothetical protein
LKELTAAPAQIGLLPRYACLEPFACLLNVVPSLPKNCKTSDDAMSGERLQHVDGACSGGDVGRVLGPSGSPLLIPRRGPCRDACRPAPDAAGIPPWPHLPSPPERWVMEAMPNVRVERASVAGQQWEEARGEARSGGGDGRRRRAAVMHAKESGPIFQRWVGGNVLRPSPTV